MGRKRKNGPSVRHVVESRGWLFYKVPAGSPLPLQAGKFVKLAKSDDVPGMHRALAILLAGTAPGTMGPVFERYEREVLSAKAPKTRRDQTKQLRRLRKIFCSLSPEAIRASDIACYLRDRTAKVSANREVALLSHCFTKAITWGMAEANPCLRVERNEENIAPDPAPELALMQAWRLASPRLRAYMAMAYVTGQRPADVVKLRDTDFTGRGLELRQNKTKTKILLTWTPNLRAAFRYALQQRAVTPLTRELFVSAAGKRITLAAIQNEWRAVMRALVAAGGERFKLKNIRSRSATDHESGAHLGHKDSRVLDKHYRDAPKVAKPL